MEHGGFFVDDLIDKLFGLVDAVCNFCGEYRLAVKTGCFYTLVGGDDNAVTFFDLLCGQDILCTA